MGCQQKTHQHHHSETDDQEMASTGTFGEAFTYEEGITASEVVALLDESDSVNAVLSGHIKASCKHSGCWMDLDLGGEEVIHVTFQDDEFTIPLDAAGKNAIVKGTAYREMIPVETLQNYAREDGKSEEEITAITEPGWEYEFIATGVIIQE